MRSKHLMPAVMVAALVAGCAPVTFAGGDGISLGMSRGAGLQLSSCAGLIGYSPEAARMGIRSPAIQMGVVRNQIQQIQNRMSFGYSGPRSMESWKGIASGECR